MPTLAKAQDLLPAGKQESLVEWFNLYMGLEAKAGSDNTFHAKKRDLEPFLLFFRQASGTDHPDQWTRSITADFLKFLDRQQKKKPTSINRILATLRHCAGWIHKLGPFLAGNPCHRTADLQLDDAEWKGLSDIEVTRLRSAAEQLLHLKKGKNQHAIRDYALFIVLLHTGLHVSELLALDLDQYQGKHFVNVKRKGKKVSRQVFLSSEAREAITRYLELRGKKPGPLFASRSGERLARQNVDDVLKQIAAQANARRGQGETIHLSAHVLRHTLLRRREKGRALRHGALRPYLQPVHLALRPAHRRAEGKGDRRVILIRLIASPPNPLYLFSNRRCLPLFELETELPKSRLLLWRDQPDRLVSGL